MKIQCSGCEAAEAKVLCCADEAALCLKCDESIHAATKVARNHHRVPLSSSASPPPKCDVCQETSGYFFCLEDRALLCRKCDFSIHTMNSLVSSHQRFLLTGVKVGLAAAETNEPRSREKLPSVKNSTVCQSTKSLSDGDQLADPSSIANSTCDGEVEGANLSTTHGKLSGGTGGTASEDIGDWHLTGSVGWIGSFENNSCTPDRLSTAEEHGCAARSEWSKFLLSANDELLNYDNWVAPEHISCSIPKVLPNYHVLSPQFLGDSSGILLPPKGSIAEFPCLGIHVFEEEDSS